MYIFNFSCNFSKTARLLLCLVFFAFTNKAFAIGYGEKSDMKSLAYLPEYQVVYMDRGTSDSIMPDEHVRLYNGDKFVARAVALEVGLFRSFWLVYQVFDDFPLKDGLNLKVVKLSKYHVPKKVKARAKSLELDYLKSELTAMTKVEEPTFQETLKLGYKEEGKEDDGTIPITETGGQLALNPNVTIDEQTGEEEIKEDNFQIGINASPVKFSRKDHAREIAYAMTANSTSWGQKELSASYSYATTTSKPAQFGPGSETIVTTSNYAASVNYDHNKIWGPLTYFMFVSFERQRDGTIYPVRYKYSGGITGVKWDIYESEKVKDFSLSYIPIMEFSKIDIESTKTVCCDQDGLEFDVPFLEQKKQQKSRHSFRFKLSWAPIQSLTISNTLWYKPYHDFANKELDLEDSLTTNSFSINYTTGSNITLGYQNEYSWDITLKRLQGQPSSNMDHIFSIGYSFTL